MMFGERFALLHRHHGGDGIGTLAQQGGGGAHDF